MQTTADKSGKQQAIPRLFLPKTMTGSATFGNARTSLDQTPAGNRRSKKAKPKGKPSRTRIYAR